MKKALFSILIVYIIAILLVSCSRSKCTHENTQWNELQKATFLAEGERELVCLDCGESLKTESLPTLLCPHAATELVTVKKPTYESDGLCELVCLDCESVFESEVLPALVCDHADAEWTENTSRKLICAECDRVLLEYPLSSSDALSADEIATLLSDSVVKVYCYGYDGQKVTSRGSGFFIDSDGTFITNSHVVKNAYFVKICTSSGEFYDVDIMYTYKYNGTDHAICRAESCVSVPVSFNPSYNVGDTVYAVGYPGEQTALNVTEGKITNKEKTVGNVTYIQNTAPIVVGNSGGVLVNDRGEALGITTGYTEPNDYLALHFDEFYADLFSERTDKTLFSYFHTKREINLSYNNFDDIFELEAADGSARVILKARLRQEKIGIDGKATVFVTLYNGDTVEAVFESEEQLKEGIVLNAPFSEATLANGEGLVIFYNTYLEI